MEIFKIIEDTFLETYVDVFLGELKVTKFNEVEDEVSRRISLEHKIDLKEEMKKHVIGGFNFETISPFEISKSLQIFIVERYIPETEGLRRELLSSLDPSDRELIKSLCDECSKIVKTKLDEIIDQLNGKEKEMKEVSRNIELRNPSPFTILKYCPERFATIAEIATKIDAIPENFAKPFYNLKREKIKIRLGKFGNLITAAFGFSNAKNKAEFDIIELLMMK